MAPTREDRPGMTRAVDPTHQWRQRAAGVAAGGFEMNTAEVRAQVQDLSRLQIEFFGAADLQLEIPQVGPAGHEEGQVGAMALQRQGPHQIVAE
eukprot:GAFH01002036.1.p4 GENE.GAFH01002036.1~~GAFH01002036.1.p4  ORF type:complete len:94 (-),score=8.97 GAFH01002036.1:568-849(-)